MASIKETKEAIEALRGMTAARTEGEWRVTFKLHRLLEMYPGNNRAWYEAKQEEIAYFTTDAEDALATAKKMFDECSSLGTEEQLEKFVTAAEQRNHLNNDPSDTVEQYLEEEKGMNKITVVINETGNAAFVDNGKQAEAARILKEAAISLRGREIYNDIFSSNEMVFNANGNMILRDANGNPVGEVKLGSNNTNSDVEASFDDPEDAQEVARLIDDIAANIEKGNTVFVLRDINGNVVGQGATIEWTADKTLLNIDGVPHVDFKAELKSGNVYLAEAGFDGIGDGPFRYVVPTSDFEPGYHQGEGDAWLVDARGVVASGYEDTQVVRELDFKQLPKAHRDDLMSLHEDSMTFEAFEKIYGDDDQDLEP